jgi:DNA-binding response OmpR family regulator
MRLLIVEDNRELGQLLTESLNASGFAADVRGSVADAVSALAGSEFAAIVLDLGLPDGDGLSLLRALRHRNDRTPVVVLTGRAARAARDDALKNGADDYLVKPFAFDELTVRIRALLRRPEDLLGASLTLGNVVLYPDARQVFVAEQTRFFPPRELAVLEVLMQHGGAVVARERLELRVFGVKLDAASNDIDVSAQQLRKQLAEAKASVQIHTIRGVGHLIIERPS